MLLPQPGPSVENQLSREKGEKAMREKGYSFYCRQCKICAGRVPNMELFHVLMRQDRAWQSTLK